MVGTSGTGAGAGGVVVLCWWWWAEAMRWERRCR